MSGHSKWNNIKRKKEKTDGAKAKIFTKIGREIAVAVKEGGADPNNNSKLKDLITKAKANNVPNDNIERCIKKAVGGSDKNEYESIMYEGYGPCGVAVMVEALTDNRNRTAGDVRHYFDKFGGNLGQQGCVSFMFSQKGLILINNDNINEEKLMEDVFDAGADDFNIEDDIIEIFTEPSSVFSVCNNLYIKGYKAVSVSKEYIPSTYTTIEDSNIVVKMQKLIDMLEDNDDVQNIWHNWDMPYIEDKE